MRLLIIFLLYTAVFTACAPGGALTPADAFSDMGSAVAHDDAASVLKLLSSQSREKIKEMCGIVNGMPAERRAAIAAAKGLKPEALESVTPEKYIFIFFMLKKDENPLTAAFMKNRIESVVREGDRAVLVLDNSMELPFVKEGPYWKFHLEGI
jgi:hypothetical protein